MTDFNQDLGSTTFSLAYRIILRCTGSFDISTYHRTGPRNAALVPVRKSVLAPAALWRPHIIPRVV